MAAPVPEYSLPSLHTLQGRNDRDNGSWRGHRVTRNLETRQSMEAGANLCIFFGIAIALMGLMYAEINRQKFPSDWDNTQKNINKPGIFTFFTGIGMSATGLGLKFFKIMDDFP